MKNEYRLMNLIDDEWVIVAEGDIDTCQDYMHEYQPEPQYKLFRKCGNCTDWEVLIMATIDRCKEYQDDDEVEYSHCMPDYKILPVC